MNDNELDRLLAKGKTESKRFFTDMQSWHSRIAHYAVSRKRVKRPLLIAGVAAAGVLAAAAACLLVFSPAAAPQSALSHQTVALDDTSREYDVNFVPVSMPRGNDSGFMMMLWQIEGDGRSQMVYSGLFSACDTLYPVATMNLPGTNRSMLLVQSGDTDQGYIHYRLLTCDDGFAAVWRAQDYVPHGAVEIKDGMLVERRSPHTGSAPSEVTYIVPYGISPSGGVVLPVDSVRLRVGEQILLAGHNGGALPVVESVSGLLSALTEDAPLPVFQASSAGADAISITKDGKTTKLEVRIDE